jgi:HK97 family phage portal protein
MSVTPDGALRVSAVFAAVRLLADTLAALPLLVYRRLPNNGGKERAPDHPLYDVLHTQPNAWQDSFQWRRMMMRHILLRGAGYNFIVPGPRGFADQLVPIHPDRVRKTEQLESGRLLYTIQGKAGARVYTQDQVFRLPGVSDDGVTCKSVISYARDSIGLALATEGYASRLFSQGALHGGLIKLPTGVSLDNDASKRMAASFQDATAKQENWHRPVVLEQGADWVPMTMTAEDSQFLLSRKFSVTDIARWFGVPPHMIADLERSTNNNIEQQSLEFVTYDLTPWLVLWEQAIARDLILNRAVYFVEFNVDGLLRGDSAARGEFYSKLFSVAALSPNDILARENMNTLGEVGDRRFVPANMRPLEAPYDPAAPGATDPVRSSSRRASPPAPPADSSSDANARALAITQEAAARVLRKEIAHVQKLAVRHAADGEAFAVAITGFYSKHATLVTEALRLTPAAASEYCASQASQVVSGDWPAALAQWELPAYAAGLAALALEGDDRDGDE